MKESVHVSENNLILNVFHQNKIVRIIMDTFSLAQSWFIKYKVIVHFYGSENIIIRYKK